MNLHCKRNSMIEMLDTANCWCNGISLEGSRYDNLIILRLCSSQFILFFQMENMLEQDKIISLRNLLSNVKSSKTIIDNYVYTNKN